MRPCFQSRQLLRYSAIGASVLFTVPIARAATAFGNSERNGHRAELVNVPSRSAVPSPTMDSLAGRSGTLRVAFLTREDVDQIPALKRRFDLTSACRASARSHSRATDPPRS
jgi:hypothetical protein